MKGIVYNIQRYSLDDGPGIRTTVFLKGCPLRCQWCSNPESQQLTPELSHRDTLCVKCGKCVAICPQKALQFDKEGKYVIDRALCDSCGICVDGCVYKALALMGETKTVDEIMEVVKRDAVFYRTSGGGLTISGGELLVQPEFAAALLKEAKKEGIHTCIETTGFASRKVVEQIFPYCDLIYYDMKQADSEKHKYYTGVPNEIILENLKYALTLVNELVVRIPFIPTVNTSEEDVGKIIQVLKAAGEVKMVHILPYHNYGAGKYKMLGIPYPLGDDIKRPEEQVINRAQKQFETAGIQCEVI